MVQTFSRVLVIFLTLQSIGLGEEEVDEKCKGEVEDKAVAHAKDHYGGSMTEYLKAHDTEGDGQVSVADLKSAFRTAGVSDECLDFATESLKHLQTHHDDDDNEKLHHDELKEFSSSGSSTTTKVTTTSNELIDAADHTNPVTWTLFAMPIATVWFSVVAA